jgi:NADH dehydrogenase/NADH:ubiquinone oxidoreductase subunit G
MEKLVKLQIDGTWVKAPASMNLLDAAELAGVHIPHLCYLKGMKGIGACRLCLVEVEGLKAPVIACNTKVKEGMIVNTKTEEVQEIRKFVVDLILAIHPLDCMTCTKAGICNLQRYAYEFELKDTSFVRKKMGYPIDETNPFIKRDPLYCILCGRCVRVCKEQDTKVLEFIGRGIESEIGTPYNKPLVESGCTFCGSCVDACPVNALPEADRWRKGREWEYEKVKSVCLLCGNGCDILVSTKDGAIQKINAGAEAGSAEKYICAYGRFGYDYLVSEAKLTVPLKRINGELKETTWKDALAIVADKLKKAGGNTGFISVAGITNEDALAMKRFAGNVVKTKNFDTTISLYADVESLKNSQTVYVNRADLFILVGLDSSQWDRVLPALDASVRKKVNRGAKLIVINSSDTKIEEAATLSLRGEETGILKSLAKALIGQGLKANGYLGSSVADAEVTEEIEKAAGLIAAADEPLIFAAPSFFDASANIALLKGKAVAVGLESNAKGVALMGLTTEAKTYLEMTGGGTNVLYAVGEVPLTNRPDTAFLIVQNSHLTELAQQADIVLPSATFLESGGTIIDYMGRLKHLHKVTEPKGQAKSHCDIFVTLSKVMGKLIKRPTETEIKKAATVKTKLTFAPFLKKEGLDASAREIIESTNASVLQGRRLSWLKEVMVVAA